MPITGTHFNYYFVCKRKLWLFSNSIAMEHSSETVALGKQVQEDSYLQRSEAMEEIAIDGIKIDFFDKKKNIIHEIKKSDSMEEAHEWQLKYYIFVLQNRGLSNVKGILEYPKLREKKEVVLSKEDKERLQKIQMEIESILQSKVCPPTIQKKFCYKCSYYDFCYVGEGE